MRILSVFSAVLVVLTLIELHQCMLPTSGYVDPFWDRATDLQENSIVMKMKNGYCYYGWIKFPRGAEIPSFLHRNQSKEPTDEFLAFILVGNVHAKATIYFNERVARKPPSDKIIARIHIKVDMYYVAESFEKYDVTKRYHIPGLKFDSPYYPASNCVYIKVPDGKKNVVYRSYLQAIGPPENTVMIKLTNGLCYYGELKYPGSEYRPNWLRPNQKEPTNDFLAFILEGSTPWVAHIYRNEHVAPMAPTGRIIARMHTSGKTYFLAQSFKVYNVHSRKRRRSDLQSSLPENLERDHLYITVPVGETSIVFKSPLQHTEIPRLKMFV